MTNFVRDLQYALRQLMAARGLAALAVLTLALGIGSNTALFTVVDDVMLRPLPYANAERLVSINPTNSANSFQATSWLNYQDLARGAGAFSSLAGYSEDVAVIQGPQGAQSVAAPRVTPNLFPMLGVRPLLGRSFDANEGLAGGPQVAMLSEALWRTGFHADPGIVGRTVTISGAPRTVIGVMPSAFRFPEQMGSQMKNAVWLPLQPTAEMTNGRGYSFFLVIGALRSGMTVEQAQAQVDAVAQRIRHAGGDGTRDLRFTVSAYQSLVTGPVRPAMGALTAGLLLVLLIACANVANMLVARFLGRRQEFAVRVALGASRPHLVRQLLTEGALLSLVGSVCGLALAEGALVLVNRLPADTLPIAGAVTLHWPVLAMMAAIATLTTVLSSLLPALLASRTDPQAALQAASRGVGSGGGGSRVSKWLVVGEVTLSTLLLMATGLLFHTLWNLEHARLGFNVSQVTEFDAVPANSLGFSNWSEPAAGAPAPVSMAVSMYAPLLQRMRSTPGVEDAALMTMPPFCGIHIGASGIDIVGRSHEMTRDIATVLTAVSPGYAHTLGIPMLRGRFIRDEDGAGAPLVAVVNAAFAKRFFPDGDPLQHGMILGGKATGMVQPYTIVGVIPDQPDASISQAAQPLILLPYQQIPTTSLFYGALLKTVVNFVVKTHGHVPVAGAMRSLFKQYAPGYALDDFQTMQKTVDDSMASQRLSMDLTASFAGLAVLMLVSGLYGVLAQVVSYRRREIGIRMALGATRNGMAGMIFREGTVLIGLGLACGLALSLMLGRLLRSFLYGVQPGDGWSLAGVIAVALFFGLLASVAPAYRAASVEPIEALRE